MIKPHPYNNRVAAIATIHNKDIALQPVFKKYLGIDLISVNAFNTDLLGTFTGEIPRKLDMVQAAREKAKQAILHSDSLIGIGSEGSFGPHPDIPFLASGFEVLLLFDSLTNNEVIVSHRFDTNYDNLIASPDDDITYFLDKIGFPQHAVIVKPENSSKNNQIIKGINNFDYLIKSINLLSTHSPTDKVCIQTDMRAHVNPTRMNSIRRLAKKLSLRLARLCPNCNTPGFGIFDVKRGLLCEECNFPTRLITAEIYKCRSCDFFEQRHERNPSSRASAMWCDNCNP